jgi:hypothetical protein
MAGWWGNLLRHPRFRCDNPRRRDDRFRGVRVQPWPAAGQTGRFGRAAEAYRKAIEFGDAEWATKATNGGKGCPDDRCACVGVGDVWLRGRGDDADALSHSVNFTAAPTSCSTPAVTASTRNSEPTL